MSLRNHQIESSRNRFDDVRDDLRRQQSQPVRPVLTSKPGEESVQERIDKGLAGMLGQAMIRSGFAILAVPDPLPFVDELVGMSLIGGGTGMVAYSRW